MAVLNVDLKMFPRNPKKPAPGIPRGSYSGPRLRVGYQWMGLGDKNPALQGNQFFVAIGYNLHGRLEQM